MGSGWERAPLASESYKKEPADQLRSVNTMQATVGHELDVLYEKIHQQVYSQVRTIHRLMMAPATEVVQKVAPVHTCCMPAFRHFIMCNKLQTMLHLLCLQASELNCLSRPRVCMLSGRISDLL